MKSSLAWIIFELSLAVAFISMLIATVLFERRPPVPYIRVRHVYANATLIGGFFWDFRYLSSPHVQCTPPAISFSDSYHHHCTITANRIGQSGFWMKTAPLTADINIF